MTLTGFEHTGKILRKKSRLEARAIRGKRTDQVEVYSQSNRKSSLKASIVDIEDTEESVDSQQQQEDDVEHLPMNEELELSDQNLQDNLEIQDD